MIAVSSPEAAELTKLLENIFRSVNIALVNELAQLCDRMGVDVWEVVDAAATKPFGFMSFKPGPGLGGHCLPVDPFYLSWKAREYDFYTEFIELAGKVNENMPYFCLEKITRALNSRGEVGEGQHGAPGRRRLQGRRRRPARVAGAQAGRAAARRGRERLLPRPARARAARARARLRRRSTARSTAADCVAIVTAHSGIDYDDLAAAPSSSSTSATPPAANGSRRRPRLEALGPTASPSPASGRGAPNLARNFNELAHLAWICDQSPERLEAAAARYPSARATPSFDELLADEAVEAVVVATPVPTHAELARRALAAGKHVFVEKPMALAAEDAEELVALAEERGLALMPGHLLLYHPGVLKLKELVDAGELGQVLYVYGNRQNLGTIRPDENALWSLGVHDLSVILFLLDEEPSEVLAPRASRSSSRASRTSSSATCASPRGRPRTCTSPGSTRTRCAG